MSKFAHLVHNGGKRWGEDEIEYLRAWVPLGIPYQTIALCDLGRTPSATYQKCRQLGIKPSPTAIAKAEGQS